MKTGFSKTVARTMTAGIALAFSATALAGSINYDFRADYSNLSYSADLPTSSKMYIKTGRLDFKGNLNDSLSYEARWAMNKPAATGATATTASNQTRDALNNSVELAYITHKMSDMFSLSIGKFNTEIGGFEGATSSADLYLVSPMYQHTGSFTTVGGALPGKNLSTNSTSQPNLLYMTGVKGIVGVGENQTISLMATNNVTDSVDAASRFDQNRGLLGITYKGAFADKTWSTMVSYHEVSPEATTVYHDKHIFIGAGLKYDALPFAAILEYLTTEFKDDASGNKDTLNTINLKLAYTMNEWTPRLEAFMAEEKVGIVTAPATSTTNKYMGVGAVLEYKPTADNFRYHIAYNTITAKPDAGGEPSRSEIVVGARLFGDFLK